MNYNPGANEVKANIETKLSRYFGCSAEEATKEQLYKACAMTVKDILTEKRQAFKHKVNRKGAKRVYYMCMEFLVGRSLKNNLCNLGLDSEYREILSDYGFDIDKLLADMGVDLETANKQDVQSLKSLSFASLFKEKGLSEVNMGIVFIFLPKSAETGKYPLFSESARGRLRQFNLGDLIYAEEGGSVGAVDVLRSMKLGSILSDTFVESYNDGEYTYSCEDKGLDLETLNSAYLQVLLKGSQPISVMKLWKVI